MDVLYWGSHIPYKGGCPTLRNSQQEIATPKDCKKSQRNIAEPEKRRGKDVGAGYSAARRIAYISVLVAISYVLKLLGNVMTFGGFKFTLIYVPWIIAGVVLGPLGGCAVAFITDVLGTLGGGLSPIPLLIVGNTLFPLFPALCYRYIPAAPPLAKIIGGSVLSLLVCTLGLNTLGLALYTGTPFLPYLAGRLTQVPVFALNLAAVCLLYPAVRQYLQKKSKKA